MTPHAIFIKLSQASVLIPIIFGWIHYKALTKPFKVLLYFFVFAFLCEVQASLMIEIVRNNMPGLHVFTVAEFLTFSTVYYLHVKENSPIRWLIIINAGVFIGIAIYNALHPVIINGKTVMGILSANDLSRTYSSVSMIIYALGCFYWLFTLNDTRHLWQYPMFWVCTGALLYFAVNSPYFVTRALLLSKNAGGEWIFGRIHATINIITYCLYAQSFRCLAKQQTASR